MEQFVDKVNIVAKAGNGGSGCVSFHREKYVLNGGPDGGDGGDGGNIVFYADENMTTLLDFRHRAKYAAKNGEDGSSAKRTGKRGEELIIKVPVGTVIVHQDTGRVIADMDHAGKAKVLLKGGRGGWGNARFATPTRQSPNFAKPGILADPVSLTLELKIIADVGLVGFPNVGKSSILSLLTSAKPKIGNYHFTTVSPNIGIVRHFEQDIVIADVPGLIEGASTGAGLGFSFLRHLERTRILLHVIDISGSEGRDPIEDYHKINLELTNYNALMSRPQVLVLNKMDLPDAEDNAQRLKSFVASRHIQVFEVSCVTRKGFDHLLDYIALTLPCLDKHDILTEDADEAEFDIKADTREYAVTLENGIYSVNGASMDRLIRSVNFSDYESLNWFHRTLRKTGVLDELRLLGAKEGDTVLINGIEFDFID